MANGMILRGEVYWICVDDSVGSEQQTGRPALIISGDTRNEKSATVIVAYMTMGGLSNNSAVRVNYSGKTERVLCDQLRTIDKQRLTRFLGKLSTSEMQRVSGGLLITMCLNPDAKISEDLFERDNADEIIALKAEIDMWKRSYDVVMNQLVEMKVAAELTNRMSKRMPEPEPVVEPVIAEPVVVVEEPPVIVEEPVVEPEPPKVEVQEETEPVEINTCTAADLKRCGCSPTVIENIINNRPYMRLDELRIVSGVTTVGYGLLKRKLCCVPVKVEEAAEEPKVEVEPVKVEPPVEEPVVEEPKVEEPAAVLEKVNINTATIKEMMNHLGVGTFYAAKISAHRNKNGKFVSLDELRMVEGLPKNFYERYAHLCTIGEPETVEEPLVVEEPVPEPVEEQKSGKVNVNTASAKEISEALGLSLNVCFAITGKRNRDGLFTSLDQIVVPKRFTEGMLEKYRDKLTIGEDEPEESEEQEPESDKVNINTASLRDLMAVGFEKRAAALIVNERKKYGRFRSVDDLSSIPEISGKILRKLREKLEV